MPDSLAALVGNASDELLTMQQVAQELKVHISTLHRWRLHGVRGARLDTLLIGGRRMVLRSQLQAFLTALNNGADSQARADPGDDVERELDAFGV